MYSWKIKIDKNKLLDVKVNASFSNTFNKKELKQIQKFYDNKGKKIHFEEKVKVDGICYKNRTKLIASWHSESKNSEKALGLIMFNPSFANQKNSDDTVRNAIKFANKEGYNKIIVLNLFSIRISGADFVCKYYPKEYLKNYKCEIKLDDLPEKVVLCWGKLPKNIPYIDSIIEKLYSELLKTDLKKKRLNKTLYQITDENFQRHLSSPSVNSIGGIEQLKLTKIQSIYKFNK